MDSGENQSEVIPMRKALSIFLALSTLLSVFACETLPTPEDPEKQNEQNENTGNPSNNQGDGDETPNYKDATSKTLVVYYSHRERNSAPWCAS